MTVVVGNHPLIVVVVFVFVVLVVVAAAVVVVVVVVVECYCILIINYCCLIRAWPPSVCYVKPMISIEISKFSL